MQEFRFKRPLTMAETMTLERSLIRHGSRLVFSPSAEVTGAIASPRDLWRWIVSQGISGLGVKFDHTLMEDSKPGE